MVLAGIMCYSSDQDVLPGEMGIFWDCAQEIQMEEAEEEEPGKDVETEFEKRFF